MKLICSKNILLEIINTVQKAVSSKSVMPILECIKLDASLDGEMVITGNNLDIAIEYKSICNVLEPGSIALSSKMFGEIIRRLPEGDVLLNVNDSNNVTTIKCANSEFNIQGLAADEYPAVPEIEENYRFSMSQEKLKKMIRKTIFAVSQNESRRPILTGALFDINTGSLNVVATDTYRLAIVTETVNSPLENKKFVIPGLTLRELLKVLKDDEEEVEIIVSNRHAMFDFGTFKVTTRLLEGEFIKYEPILKTPNSIYVTVNIKDFTESLERASLLINDDMTAKAEKVPVRLNIALDKIEITCITGKGMVHDMVDAGVNGNDIEIGFNHRYLLEALRACEDEKIKLEFSNPRSSCFIRSEEDNSFTYMVLPVRLYNE